LFRLSEVEREIFHISLEKFNAEFLRGWGERNTLSFLNSEQIPGEWKLAEKLWEG
jgi:hypothetical protein